MNLDPTTLPRHLGIIMDGNGRWAKEKGLPRLEGHRKGADVVEDVSEYCRELGISYLTLYAFSVENWNRPDEEVKALMLLLAEFLIGKKDKMIQNGIALNAIGDIQQLPENVQALLQQTIKDTSFGKKMTLTLALSYGSRNEIVRACQKIAHDISNKHLAPNQITEETLSQNLDTHNLPDPDLIIRTSGESRISNFLLWQAAYAEFLFTPVCWPDFSKQHLETALAEYQKRERRFGLTSEQLD